MIHTVGCYRWWTMGAGLWDGGSPWLKLGPVTFVGLTFPQTLMFETHFLNRYCLRIMYEWHHEDGRL